VNAGLKIEYFDDADFDPFALDDMLYGDIEDVFAVFDKERAKGAVQERAIIEMLGVPLDSLRTGVPEFSVISFNAAQIVLRNPVIFSNASQISTLGQTVGDAIPMMDGLVHTQVRKQLEPFFLPNQITKWSSAIVEPVVAGLINQFIDRGEAELIEEFAKPYPFQIIYRQLDLPADDALKFHKLAVTLSFVGDGQKYGIEAGRKLETYYEALIAQRREHPGTDLVSLLAGKDRDSSIMTDDRIIAFLKLLINAAGDTTYRSTGSILIGLLTHPDQLEAVRRDRSLVPKVLEEGLRWNGPFTTTQRLVTADTEIEGVKIPKGAVIHVGLAAANNDPAVFERPREFNLFRGTRHHVGFGMGPHMCVGQHLARLEMNRALNAILDRLPNLRLDPSKPRPTIRGGMMRTPRDVHVLFD